MIENMMAVIALSKALAERRPEPKPMKLTDAQLNELLVAIQDGEVNYGSEDCEVIGELICEVLEYRQRDRVRQVTGGGDPRVQPPSFWKSEREQRIAADRAAFMERAMRERREAEQRFKTSPRAKGEPFWQADVNRDVHTLYAPNGQKLYTVSGLDMLQMKNPQTEMGLIAEREVAKWRSNGGS